MNVHNESTQECTRECTHESIICLDNKNNECIICLDNINNNSITYICPQCQIIVHIECKNRWIQLHPNNNTNQYICPHCKYISENGEQSNIIVNIRNNTSHIYVDYLLQVCFNTTCATIYVIIIILGIYFLFDMFLKQNVIYNSTRL